MNPFALNCKGIFALIQTLTKTKEKAETEALILTLTLTLTLTVDFDFDFDFDFYFEKRTLRFEIKVKKNSGLPLLTTNFLIIF